MSEYPVHNDPYISGPLFVGELQESGIHPNDIKKLAAAGLNTVASVAYSPKIYLATIEGISGPMVDNILAEAQKFVPPRFYIRRYIFSHITTGSKQLDALLGGGIEAGVINQLLDECRPAKLALYHTLAVTCQLPRNEGGGSGKCLYIDTEGTFRPADLLAIAEHYGLNGQDVLDNIEYARVYSLDDVNSVLTAATALMCQSRFSVLIFDSYKAQYFSGYVGSGVPTSASDIHLRKFLQALQRLADEFEIGVAVTNPVMSNLEVHLTSTNQLQLHSGLGNTFTCTMHDSYYLPEGNTQASILAGGIGDLEEL